MKRENSYTPFYNSFLYLCKRKGVSPTTAAKASGIAAGSPTAWKNGAVPKQAQREKLCKYFGVTENELLGYESQQKKPAPMDGDELTEKQRYLIEAIRTMSPDMVTMLTAVVDQALGKRSQ